MPPFFSIILPTKDRPALAQSVIHHTLQQSFTDFELVVVDNGSEESVSLEAVNARDSRVRVIKTGGLSMPDNWQAGLDAARGLYVLMIEDKLLLVADALEICSKVLRENNCVLMSWLMGVCDSENDKQIAAVGSVEAYTLKTKNFLEFSSHCMLDYYQKQAPRGINMLVEREYAQSVQAKAGPLCRAMSPDYSLGALTMAHTDSFIHVNAVLARVIRSAPSNGANLAQRNAASESFFQSLKMTEVELLAHVPIKVFSLHNLMVSDLFRFWRAAGLSESAVKLNWNGYFLMMICDCLLMGKQKVDFHKEEIMIRDSFRKKSLQEKVSFFVYAAGRFKKGWPNRKLRMRENFPDFVKALQFCF